MKPKKTTTLLGHTIRLKRGSIGQLACSAEIGMAQGTLSRIERGNHVPSGRNLTKLAAWLDWSVEDVIEAARKPSGPGCLYNCWARLGNIRAPDREPVYASSPEKAVLLFAKAQNLSTPNTVYVLEYGGRIRCFSLNSIPNPIYAATQLSSEAFTTMEPSL